MVWTGSLLWFFKNLFFFQTVHGKIYRCSCFLRSRLTYSRPLGGETIFFILYLFCRVVYPMSFAIHCYNYLEKAQTCHLCMMVRSHYLKTIVEKHILTLRSISNQFFSLKLEWLIWPRHWSSKQNANTCFLQFEVYFSSFYSW